jgi:cellobiose phosphorylase
VTQLADAIRTDFQRTLMPDGLVAGFAVFGPRSDHVDEYLLHPRDKTTGIHYRLISMSRGILSGIFSPAQAEHHLDLVRQHLLAPDGARLMDRPTRYQGGRETVFRRSESASFFGREIGLQYTHAHLRYAEALATMGRADELLQALLTANPIAVTEVVKNARMRQRNCYFSSSDAAFTDRYQASESYDKVRTGEIPVDGGWRIYSSGPGIYTNLVVRHLFGLRRFFDFVEFDPVLPRKFVEVCCDTVHESRKVRYRFLAVENSSGSAPISINGMPIASCIRAKNAYRPAGIRILRSEFQRALNLPENVVQIEMQLQREVRRNG